ncbi:MAG: phosphatase [Cryomorphaceae bacterium]|nr:phosphatase [Cryomorphaceae bacterium]
MRIGIIDCGTNTFNLLIADTTATGWTKVFGNKVSVKLGHGGFTDGNIRVERMARALDAMKVHYNNLLNFDVKKTIVFATSAMREAGNGELFIQHVKQELGLDVVVIDGDREAQLIYDGVRQTIDAGAGNDLIVDIGGGSTEFIVASADGIKWKASFPIGVARLYEYVEPDDPITPEQIQKLCLYLDDILKPLESALEQYPIVRLIGSSGSFDTLVDLFHSAGRIPAVRGLSNEIPLAVFEEIHRYLLISSRETRLAMRGMLPLRVDYIVLASIVIQHLVTRFHIVRMFQSEYALKEGVIAGILNKEVS